MRSIKMIMIYYWEKCNGVHLEHVLWKGIFSTRNFQSLFVCFLNCYYINFQDMYSFLSFSSQYEIVTRGLIVVIVYYFQIWNCREEENLVFWFGAQFISTLNFNQSGWLILFSPDFHFRPPKLISRQTQSLWLGTQTRTDVPLPVPT